MYCMICAVAGHSSRSTDVIHQLRDDDLHVLRSLARPSDVEVFDSSSNSAKLARTCAYADYSSRSAEVEALRIGIGFTSRWLPVLPHAHDQRMIRL